MRVTSDVQQSLPGYRVTPAEVWGSLLRRSSHWRTNCQHARVCVCWVYMNIYMYWLYNLREASALNNAVSASLGFDSSCSSRQYLKHLRRVKQRETPLHTRSSLVWLAWASAWGSRFSRQLFCFISWLSPRSWPHDMCLREGSLFGRQPPPPSETRNISLPNSCGKSLVMKVYNGANFPLQWT